MNNRVLVTGGRNYKNRRRVFSVLDKLRPDLVIQGGASGADVLAASWAMIHGVACFTCDAPWNALGRRAGPVRNRWMIQYGQPDLVVAFPGGRGTADCVRAAREANVEVVEVDARE